MTFRELCRGADGNEAVSVTGGRVGDVQPGATRYFVVTMDIHVALIIFGDFEIISSNRLSEFEVYLDMTDGELKRKKRYGPLLHVTVAVK